MYYGFVIGDMWLNDIEGAIYLFSIFFQHFQDFLNSLPNYKTAASKFSLPILFERYFSKLKEYQNSSHVCQIFGIIKFVFQLHKYQSPIIKKNKTQK